MQKIPQPRFVKNILWEMFTGFNQEKKYYNTFSNFKN